jgi:hypothetical protein
MSAHDTEFLSGRPEESSAAERQTGAAGDNNKLSNFEHADLFGG